ncbi:MAG: metallophosphoesterase [Schleiferiaceae bacterium]
MELVRTTVFTSLVAMIIGGCSPNNSSNGHSTQPLSQEKTAEYLPSDSITELEDGLNFYVLGDWGRQGYYHQKELAEMMQKVGAQVEAEFIISTGDNFYDNGVASVDDPQWTYSFEEVYMGNHLQVPWYVVLGNHDYRGNVQAEIDYSSISRRWTMPSRYWFTDMEMEDDSDPSRFFFLDTSPFEDEYYTEKKYYQVAEQDSTAQLNWFKESLANTPDNVWKICVGHHPLYTGGKRRDDKNYVRGHLEPSMDESKVDVYFCGHEHDIQHIKKDGHPTHHFVSGAGAEVRPTGEIEGTQFARSETAFLVVSMTADQMLVQAVNYKGELMYSTLIDRKVDRKAERQ